MARFNFKKSLKLITTTFLFLFGTLMLNVHAAHADPLGQITEYSGPGGAIGSMAEDSSGENIWFVNSNGVVKFNKASQQLNSYGYSGASLITKGPDGALWFSSNAVNSMFRIAPSGSIQSITETNGYGTSAISDLTTGPDGKLWAADYSNKRVLRMTTSIVNPAVTSFVSYGTQPVQLAPDYKNNGVWALEQYYQWPNPPQYWITWVGVDGNIGSRHAVPAAYSNVTTITVGADDNVWFVPRIPTNLQDRE